MAKMHHFTKFHQNRSAVAEILQFSIFQDGGQLPCCICLRQIWITHKGYLAVFSTSQNLVAIDAVV